MSSLTDQKKRRFTSLRLVTTRTNREKLLKDLLDKNQLYVHLSEIEDELFNVSELDKALNRGLLREGKR